MWQPLALQGTAAAHNGPDVDQVISVADVVAVVAVGRRVEVGGDQLYLFAQGEAVAVLPAEDSEFGTLIFNLYLGAAGDLIGGLEHRFVAGIDRYLVGMVAADDCGEDVQGGSEIVVAGIAALLADVVVGGIHEDVGTGL